MGLARPTKNVVCPLFARAQVYWYRGGIESWRAANLPFSESTLYAQVY
jgi:hypothetical protein